MINILKLLLKRDGKMKFDEFTRKRISKVFDVYCENRMLLKPENNNYIKYKVHGNTVTVFESKSPNGKPTMISDKAVVQFRFNSVNNKWNAFALWSGNDWVENDFIEPTEDLEKLLNSVDNDPYMFFWR